MLYNTSYKFPVYQAGQAVNVTSGGIGVVREHQLQKKPNPSLLSKEEQRKKGEKTKVLTQNKYMAMGPSGARCQE
jgi:hypothetical protein